MKTKIKAIAITIGIVLVLISFTLFKRFFRYSFNILLTIFIYCFIAFVIYLIVKFFLNNKKK